MSWQARRVGEWRHGLQLIAHESERCYEADAEDEAHDLGYERVEAGHDEEASKNSGTNVAGSKYSWGMSSGDYGASAHVRVYADFHDGAAC